MTSKHISQTSAIVLFAGGALLLFVPEMVLAPLVPGLPPTASWLGQLVGAGWLSVGALDWLSRFAILGGVYGRPVVTANLWLHFISAMVVIRAAVRPEASAALPWIAAPIVVLAVVYGWLLFRGPLEREMPGGVSE